MHRKVATSANVSDGIAGAFVLDNEGSLEQGGVEIDISEAEWFYQVMDYAMVASEDKLWLGDALGGDECLPWSDVIEVELSQIEKLSTWKLVKLPPSTNIIPSHYVFC
jgi:hypothetical protein